MPSVSWLQSQTAPLAGHIDPERTAEEGMSRSPIMVARHYGGSVSMWRSIQAEHVARLDREVPPDRPSRGSRPVHRGVAPRGPHLMLRARSSHSVEVRFAPKTGRKNDSHLWAPAQHWSTKALCPVTGEMIDLSELPATEMAGQLARPTGDIGVAVGDYMTNLNSRLISARIRS